LNRDDWRSAICNILNHPARPCFRTCGNGCGTAWMSASRSFRPNSERCYPKHVCLAFRCRPLSLVTWVSSLSCVPCLWRSAGPSCNSYSRRDFQTLGRPYRDKERIIGEPAKNIRQAYGKYHRGQLLPFCGLHDSRCLENKFGRGMECPPAFPGCQAWLLTRCFPLFIVPVNGQSPVTRGKFNGYNARY